jgi:ribulose 1,5-bisphosphate synthetase/thiazole synthase
MSSISTIPVLIVGANFSSGMRLTSIYPVSKVGAGPSGLILALALSINGVGVRLVDREQTYRVGSKGAGIWVRAVFMHIH